MPTNGARTPSTSSIGTVRAARAAREPREIFDHVVARADRVGDRIARAEPQHADRGLGAAGAAARLAEQRQAHDDRAVAAAEHDQIARRA